MNGVVALLMALLSGAMFEVSQIAVDDGQAMCFMAQGPTGRTDLMVLIGNRLRRYPSADLERMRTVDLEEGASAFDIADLDNDEIPELVFVQGNAVKRLTYGAKASSAETMFTLETTLSAASKAFPYVLVTEYEGEPVIALPQPDALEFRRLNGDLAARFPVGEDAPLSMAFGRPFQARTAQPPQVAGDSGIEFRISAVSAHRPILPDMPGFTVEPMGTTFRHGTPRQTREALDQPSHLWPWFPIAPEEASSDHALYAAEAGRVTVIRIEGRRVGSVDGNTNVGPARRYPGQLLAPAGVFPDFNGDGLTDLLLWDAPEPVPSVGSITRALATRSWPLRLTVHLYDPERHRFAAKPAAVLQLRPPVAWYLERIGRPPLRHLVLTDFDGDGRTDLGCAVAPKSYSIWRWGEAGFGSAPDFVCDLAEEVGEVAFQADLDGAGRTTIGLRGKSVIYVVKSPKETAQP